MSEVSSPQNKNRFSNTEGANGL